MSPWEHLMCMLGRHDWTHPSPHGSKRPHRWCRRCLRIQWLA